jgi:hypothetical protein
MEHKRRSGSFQEYQTDLLPKILTLLQETVLQIG